MSVSHAGGAILVEVDAKKRGMPLLDAVQSTEEGAAIIGRPSFAEGGPTRADDADGAHFKSAEEMATRTKPTAPRARCILRPRPSALGQSS